MKGALHAGRLFGINIFIHWTFLLLIGWVVYREVNRGSGASTIMWTVTFVLVVFLCVVFHELGHSLTARRFGISTKKITLLPIGGVASLEKMPEKPSQELLVAVAGPAVNIVIALFLLLFLPLGNFLAMSPEEQLFISPATFLYHLFLVNVVLVIFNAIPAFPMDGGRVLRALLAMGMPRVKATRIAASIGQGIAILFFIIGLFYNPILAFVAIFIFFGAYSENMMVQQLDLLKGYRVRDAMMTHISTLESHQTIGEVIRMLIDGTEQHFVVQDKGIPIGVLFQNEIIKSAQTQILTMKVQDVMSTDFRSLGADEKLSSVYSQPRGKNAFFPVVQNGLLVGALDMKNISEFLQVQAALHY